MSRDPALDGLRGVAVVLVFLFHYGGGLRAHNPLLRAFGYLSEAGWIGVELFFALSGFLITNILADRLLPPAHQRQSQATTSLTLRNFYGRRALRILPLYYVALAACAAAALLAGAHPSQFRSLGIYAVFLQNLPPLVEISLHTPPPLPLFHLWSLAVEEQFYLLWPFLLLTARTPQRALHLSLWTFALTAVARGLIFSPHILAFGTAQSFATFLPFRAGGLTLGAALAIHLRRGDAASSSSEKSQETEGLGRSSSSPEANLSPEPLLFTTVIATVLLFLSAFLSRTFLLNSASAHTLTLPAADLLAACILALSLQTNFLRRALSHPALRLLGRISYGFYVFHILLQPLFDCLGALLTHAHTGFAYQAARLFIAFPVTVVAAWLSFTLLERPFLRLKRRFPIPASRIQPA